MKEWMNERMNEWKNEWMNEWKNEWMNERMNEWNEKINERNEKMSERNEKMNERNEKMNERMNDVVRNITTLPVISPYFRSHKTCNFVFICQKIDFEFFFLYISIQSTF